jgi:SAM-dependent methyltransferase
MRALESELDDLGEDRLYRESQVYLYDLTVFAMSGTKEPYLDLIARHIPSGGRLLDYGCGIGSDGLRLLEAGYEVEFADFDNPSVEYLRWRLARRGIEAPIHNLDDGFDLPRVDLAYSFDVIEHVDDPFAFLARLEEVSDRVLVNFLAPDPHDTAVHHDLPIRKLLRHAARRRLVEYELHHERSHVVLYGTSAAGAVGYFRNLARVMR